MATRNPRTRWLIAIVVLLLFIVAMIVLDRTLPLDTVAHWVLRIGFLVLGLVAAGAILWYLRPHEKEPVLDPSDDVLLVVAGARNRLPRHSFANRAMVVVLGPPGGTKSSLVGHAGGDPQLLAGDAVMKPGGAPPSTKTANVWAMQQSIIVELAGSLLSDGARWSKVIRALRAPRVSAAMSTGGAAPRAAVVCVPCDIFYEGANGQQLAALGVSLRQRLAEASRELGLALPVYVVFTKMDRIPHFESWIGAYTKDELRAPLGATLPMDPMADTGNYAERLTPRLDAAFRAIVDSVASRRVDVLGRDTVQERRYGAYELPRELRKLSPSVSMFLVELCRPTQLGSSPQLRGFYFTGARPVIVSDVAQSPSARAAAPTAAADATAIFRQAMQPAMATAAAPSATSRKVPEWVFLERFIRDVVLADTGAHSIASGGVRVQSTRRLFLGASIAASLLVLTGVTVSWLGNRAISGRLADAARGVAALPVVQSSPGVIAFPSADALRRLDVLRAQLDTVRTYEKHGPPMYLRFGLWQGESLIKAARPVWYDGFRRQLFAAGWGAIVDSLKALPEEPTASNDYGTAYAWLKAYLITTSAPERSTPELAPVLLTSWQRGQTTDADITALARRQFEFYGSELPTFNPFPTAASTALVTHARTFLARFTGGEQIYRNMLAAANKSIPAVKMPQTPGILTTIPEVAGSFSVAGAKFMADAFRNSESYFKGETWVVGDATASRAVDRESVIAGIRARYHEDYARTWVQVVQRATVSRPGSVKEAADKLDILSGTTSPMLQLLRVTAVNTNHDSTTRATFQPVHAVTPPAVLDKFVSEKNQPYMEGLLGLAGALRQVSNMPPPVDTASALAMAQQAQTAGNEVTKARTSVRRVAQGFTVSPAAASVAAVVEQLLGAPISGAEAVLRTAASMKPPTKRIAVAAPPPKPAPAAGGGGGGGGGIPLSQVLNEQGQALCMQVRPVVSKFPFNPDAAADVTMEELTALLAPNDGAVWVFAQGRLKPFLEEKDGKWSGKAVGDVQLSPAFLKFFNRAAEVSRALFPAGAATPGIRWNVEAVITPDQTPVVELQFGTKRASFNTATPRNEVVWPTGRDAQLDATFKKNKPVTVSKGSGEWALFRLALPAKFEGMRGTWPASGKDASPVVMEFEAQRGAQYPVLHRGWLGQQMSCVAQVTQ